MYFSDVSHLHLATYSKKNYEEKKTKNKYFNQLCEEKKLKEKCWRRRNQHRLRKIKNKETTPIKTKKREKFNKLS